MSNRESLYRMMRKHWKNIVAISVVIAAAAVAVAYAVAPDRELTERDKIVATVNGKPISVKRFNESYVNYLITTGHNDTEANRYRHLNSLIDTYLLAAEADRRGMDEDPAYKTFYERKLKHTVGGQFYYEVFLDTLAPLTDAEVRLAYKRSQEKILVRHLLFNNPEDADRAYERLQSGEDFVQLANEVYETEAFDSMAGFLGVAGYWDLDDAFAEVAFPLPAGQPSKPVRTQYGYHIILKEDHLYNPILTESEYSVRKEGVSQRAHMRKMRMEGGRFIHDYMMSLGVEVNNDAIYQLRDAIKRLSVKPNEQTQQPPPHLSSAEIAVLRDEFTPGTALLTYELDGERRQFTALEYYNWLPELPYGEAKNRTAASVGRALRNEVLAIQGFEKGLDEHEVVTEHMQFASNLYLASALRNHLRENEKADPTPDEVEEAFDRLRYRTLKKADADFWMISFDGYDEASDVKAKIDAGADPASFDGYEYRTRQDLRELGALGGHVRRMLLGSPFVLGAADEKWYVIQVDDRELEWTTLEEKELEIRHRLATFMPEAKLAGDLRSKAEVTVDAELFEEMMKFK